MTAGEGVARPYPDPAGVCVDAIGGAVGKEESDHESISSKHVQEQKGRPCFYLFKQTQNCSNLWHSIKRSCEKKSEIASSNFEPKVCQFSAANQTNFLGETSV